MLSNRVANFLLGTVGVPDPRSPTAPSVWHGLSIHFLRWIATARQAEGASEMEAPSALGFQ